MTATAYILISVSVGKARQVYEKMLKMPGVQHVDAISGPYDIIATIQGSDFNQIGTLVLDRIQAIEGVVDTITCNVIFFEV
ncbi:MAG: Lrp/AsnC family transcriptional regulator [Candidatus Zixiibacteriota bacterium]|nr:MAG: Lrp/AsnC family transcriptional regulator [candidate division Zixibacteria bacterium]